MSLRNRKAVTANSNMQKNREQLSCPVPAVKTLNPTKKSRSGMLSRDYNLSVEWSEEDQAYVGYCRELFPYGGVCHDENRIAAYAKLVEVVEWHLEDEAAAAVPRSKTIKTGVISRVRANPRSSRPIKVLGKLPSV
jgi:hypothetical protein